MTAIPVTHDVHRDRELYELANRFLIDRLNQEALPPGVSGEDVLKAHIVTPNTAKPQTLPEIYHGLIGSAANTHQMPRVVMGSLPSQSLSDLKAVLLAGCSIYCGPAGVFNERMGTALV